MVCLTTFFSVHLSSKDQITCWRLRKPLFGTTCMLGGFSNMSSSTYVCSYLPHISSSNLGTPLVVTNRSVPNSSAVLNVAPHILASSLLNVLSKVMVVGLPNRLKISGTGLNTVVDLQFSCLWGIQQMEQALHLYI